MFQTIIEFILALGVLIFLHELGHYLVARLFKIEVEEFGLGFPPRLVKLFTLAGTEFTLNWIPFGAFVRPKGENDPDVPGGLASANPWKRLAVLLGGPVVNIVTGILLFSILFTSIGAPVADTVQIVEVQAGTPAEISGLKAGDILRKIGEEEIKTSDQLRAIVQQNLGKEITMTVERGGQMVELRTTPRVNPPEGQGALGIVMGGITKPISWFQSLPIAARVTYEQIASLVTLPAKIAQGAVTPDESRVVGPVGMFNIYNQVREMDVESSETTPATTPVSNLLNRLTLLATISVALGITNLLPIPALDGGRIIFLLPEILFRRRVPPQYENIVHLIGFAALLLLMVYITTQDIIRPINLP